MSEVLERNHSAGADHQAVASAILNNRTLTQWLTTAMLYSDSNEEAARRFVRSLKVGSAQYLQRCTVAGAMIAMRQLHLPEAE